MRLDARDEIEVLPTWLGRTTLTGAAGQPTTTAIYQIAQPFYGPADVPLSWPWEPASEFATETLISILGGTGLQTLGVSRSSSAPLSSSSSASAVWGAAATQVSGSGSGNQNGALAGAGGMQGGSNGQDGSHTGASPLVNASGGSSGGSNLGGQSVVGASGNTGTSGGQAGSNSAGTGSSEMQGEGASSSGTGAMGAGSSSNGGAGSSNGGAGSSNGGVGSSAGGAGNAGSPNGSGGTDGSSPAAAGAGGGVNSPGTAGAAGSPATGAGSSPVAQGGGGAGGASPDNGGNGGIGTTAARQTVITLPNGSLTTVPAGGSPGALGPTSVSTTLPNGQTTVVPAFITTLPNGGTTTLVSPIAATPTSQTPSVTLPTGSVAPGTVMTLSNGMLTTAPLVPTTYPNGFTSLVPSLNSDAAPSDGLSAGQIAGIVIGALAGAALLALLLLCAALSRRRRDLSGERRRMGKNLSWQQMRSGYRDDPEMTEAGAGLMAYADRDEGSQTSRYSRASALPGGSRGSSATALAGVGAHTPSSGTDSQGNQRIPSYIREDELFYSMPRTPPRPGPSGLPPGAALLPFEHRAESQSRLASFSARPTHLTPPSRPLPIPPASPSSTATQTPHTTATEPHMTEVTPQSRSDQQKLSPDPGTLTSDEEHQAARDSRLSSMSAEEGQILTATRAAAGRVLSGLGFGALFAQDRVPSGSSQQGRRAPAIEDDSPTLGYQRPGDAPRRPSQEDTDSDNEEAVDENTAFLASKRHLGSINTRWSQTPLGKPVLRQNSQRAVSVQAPVSNISHSSSRRVASENLPARASHHSGESRRRLLRGDSDDESVHSLPYYD